MSISEDDLRAVLRSYADSAGPAGFPAEPLIRTARRRRARFTAAAVAGAVAVVAAAVVAAAAPAATRGPASYVPPITPGAAAGNGAWPTPFRCGQPLPSALPGPAGYALRLSVGPIARTASGQPHVTWYMAGTLPGGFAPAFGKTEAIVLVVRDDGTIVAVQRGGLSPSKINIPLNLLIVPAGQIAATKPRFVACQPSSWRQVWAHHQRYGVVVLLTAWVGYPGANPARLGAAAALP